MNNNTNNTLKTSTGKHLEDMGLAAAAKMIGINRRYAYKLARACKLEITRKTDSTGAGKWFVSKRSVFAAMRRINVIGR